MYVYQMTHHEEDLDRILILSMMSDIRLAKPKYETTLVNEFPPLTTISDNTFVGSFAWTAATAKWKLIDRSTVIDMFDQSLTPADVARDYIRAKYKKPGRVTTGQYQETVAKHRFAPLFARVGEYDDCSYIDLKSAYWSILQVIGWDVDYHPNRWLNVRSTCRDFPLWKNKLARNCIVSVGLIGQTKMWNGSKLIFMRRGNALANMVLYSCVMDILHSVASDMVRAGAVYVHTDGYVLPTQYLSRAYQVLDAWGLVGTVRDAGRTTVFNVGTYEMPHHRNGRGIDRMGKDFSNVISDYRNFLQPRFRKFAYRSPLILE